MISPRYHLNARSACGVYLRTFSRSKRKIYAKTRGLQRLQGNLRVVYQKEGHDVAENETNFDGRDDLISAMAVFSERELLDFIDGASS